MHTGVVEFEWDPSKARTNLQKHNVDFADAVGVFDDPFALTREDPHPNEPRQVTLGSDSLNRILVVCWTPRRTAIRIISARRATPAERRQYEKDT